ncbi:MAG: hypothetical protein ABR577_10980 [Pyrinomonadaceae bacterium]
MNQLALFNEIISLYLKHGWRLERLLLAPQTRAECEAELAANSSFQDVVIREAAVDAVWFKRAAGQGGREAWELRLAADVPYALFETFEADEAEDEREDVRREMESRLIAHAHGGA